VSAFYRRRSDAQIYNNSPPPPWIHYYNNSSYDSLSSTELGLESAATLLFCSLMCGAYIRCRFIRNSEKMRLDSAGSMRMNHTILHLSLILSYISLLFFLHLHFVALPLSRFVTEQFCPDISNSLDMISPSPTYFYIITRILSSHPEEFRRFDFLIFR
jgi:hypothetical protein